MGFPFMALAEAIIPGSKKVPAADEATYARSILTIMATATRAAERIAERIA